jgi:hypothetical protein
MVLNGLESADPMKRKLLVQCRFGTIWDNWAVFLSRLFPYCFRRENPISSACAKTFSLDAVYVATIRDLLRLCQHCYMAWRQRERLWPPGTFRATSSTTRPTSRKSALRKTSSVKRAARFGVPYRGETASQVASVSPFAHRAGGTA